MNKYTERHVYLPFALHMHFCGITGCQQMTVQAIKNVSSKFHDSSTLLQEYIQIVMGSQLK
jgi:hypothetical protein